MHVVEDVRGVPGQVEFKIKISVVKKEKSYYPKKIKIGEKINSHKTEEKS